MQTKIPTTKECTYWCTDACMCCSLYNAHHPVCSEWTILIVDRPTLETDLYFWHLFVELVLVTPVEGHQSLCGQKKQANSIMSVIKNIRFIYKQWKSKKQDGTGMEKKPLNWYGLDHISTRLIIWSGPYQYPTDVVRTISGETQSAGLKLSLIHISEPTRPY